MAEETMSKSAKPTIKSRLAFLGKVFCGLLIAAIIIFDVYCLFAPSSRYENTRHIQEACQDNLRELDGAIMMYTAGHQGTSPSSIEELVPEYLKEVPTCPGDGYYFLDISTTPPHAACSMGHTY